MSNVVDNPRFPNVLVAHRESLKEGDEVSNGKQESMLVKETQD
jgi:hypothetical protein